MSKHVPTPYPSPAPGHHKVKVNGITPSTPSPPSPSSAQTFEEEVTSFGTSAHPQVVVSKTNSVSTVVNSITNSTANSIANSQFDNSSSSSYSERESSMSSFRTSNGQANATIDLRRTIQAANGQATTGPSPPGSSASLVGFVAEAGSERSSDTDSTVSLHDAERKPLLQQQNSNNSANANVGVTNNVQPYSNNNAHNNISDTLSSPRRTNLQRNMNTFGVASGVTLNGDIRHGVTSQEVESDDTDSFGTPSGSPAKGKVMQRVSSIESGKSRAIIIIENNPT